MGLRTEFCGLSTHCSARDWHKQGDRVNRDIVAKAGTWHISHEGDSPANCHTCYPQGVQCGPADEVTLKDVRTFTRFTVSCKNYFSFPKGVQRGPADRVGTRGNLINRVISGTHESQNKHIWYSRLECISLLQGVQCGPAHRVGAQGNDGAQQAS